MQDEFRRQIIALLDQHRIMTIATNRPDGWPQATVVGYANDGLIIYCFIGHDSQKYANITRDPRVSVAIANDYPQPLLIKGLSMAARVAIVTDEAEVDRALECLLRRYPEYRNLMTKPDPAQVPMLRLTPQVVSVLDYSKGFGHADLVRVTESDFAEHIEGRQHTWGAPQAA
jgi:PPOX class probable F420-dependent enzyme